MARYHMKKDGTPGICNAQPGNCPLGGDDNHIEANSPEQAQRYFDDINENIEKYTRKIEREKDTNIGRYSKYPDEVKKFFSYFRARRAIIDNDNVVLSGKGGIGATYKNEGEHFDRYSRAVAKLKEEDKDLTYDNIATEMEKGGLYWDRKTHSSGNLGADDWAKNQPTHMEFANEEIELQGIKFNSFYSTGGLAYGDSGKWTRSGAKARPLEKALDDEAKINDTRIFRHPDHPETIMVIAKAHKKAGNWNIDRNNKEVVSFITTEEQFWKDLGSKRN